ncbi:Bifunctional cytokinin biosynthesis protein [Golovinomyces cichoracearum]|uniref:Bifunctional cytokinin biosynthesis protein n=1 Tax=Golovinomyces cichoracearum TaxID=62708 RepID=A0A420I9X6_9PEZI|nr:Bifunctional cytokinin biosynthesis protein [Golovinomyces cichoracearum]
MPSADVKNTFPVRSVFEKKPKRVICVFCGSSPGSFSAHMEAARTLARVFHENDINLVYGGGTTGLMGEMAKTLVSLSGAESVHGIIPAPFLNCECDLDGNLLTEPVLPDREVYGKTTVVNSMHARKRMMVNEVLSGTTGSGFIALPGGFGTMEELMEVATWNQIGVHDKGVVIFNVAGYWNYLLEWIKDAVGAGFIAKSTSNIIGEGETAEQCVELLRVYEVAEGGFNLKWNSF